MKKNSIIILSLLAVACLGALLLVQSDIHVDLLSKHSGPIHDAAAYFSIYPWTSQFTNGAAIKKALDGCQKNLPLGLE